MQDDSSLLERKRERSDSVENEEEAADHGTNTTASEVVTTTTTAPAAVATDDGEENAPQVGQIRRKIKDMVWKEDGHAQPAAAARQGDVALATRPDTEISTPVSTEPVLPVPLEGDGELASPPRKAKRLAAASDQDDASDAAQIKKPREEIDSSTDLSTAKEISIPKDAPAKTSEVSRPSKASGFAAFSSSASPFASVPSSSKPFGMLSKSSATSSASPFATSATPGAAKTPLDSQASKKTSGFGMNTSSASPFGGKKTGFGSSMAAASPLATAGAEKTENGESLETVENAESLTTKAESQKSGTSSKVETSSEPKSGVEPVWNELLKTKGGQGPESINKVSLKEQEVITGEEEEDLYHSVRTKLYVMDESQSWKERGIGNLKLNCKGSTFAESPKSARLVMRAEGTHRLLLNVPLLPRFSKSISVQQDRFVRFISVEDGKILKHFTAKLSTPSAAQELKAAMVDLVVSLHQDLPKTNVLDAPVAA